MNNESIADLWLVQWSETQHQFHLEQVGTLLRDEVRAFVKRERRADYITLAVCATHKDGDAYIEALGKARGMYYDDQIPRWRDLNVKKKAVA
jgi:hypothetical protein